MPSIDPDVIDAIERLVKQAAVDARQTAEPYECGFSRLIDLFIEDKTAQEKDQILLVATRYDYVSEVERQEILQAFR